MDVGLDLFDPGPTPKNKRKPSQTLPESLPPEIEEGNIEYKLKLINPSPSRFEHLITQMKWRLQEGGGEAFYEIGVEDNGVLVGLVRDELEASMSTLNKMAKRLGASLTVIRETELNQSSEGESSVNTDVKKVLEVLIRKLPEDHQFIDIRVAVLGGVDSGKSTTLGVLTQGELDNGRGRARLNLFRHLHEIQTGRTSSISHEILGFGSDGQVYNHSEQRTVVEILENSSKVVSFIDLCGHHKYLRTTIYGLTGYSPDCAMLVVAANMGIVGTLKEHLGYTLALQVPAFMVVTKLDACKPTDLQQTLTQLERLVRSPGCGRMPLLVSNVEDATTAAANFSTGRVCPIIPISCVSGENIDSLLRFLHLLPATQSNQERQNLIQGLPELQIDEVYTLPSVGTIVGGTLLKGTVQEGDTLSLGPDFEGRFVEVRVGSVHRNRLPCRLAVAGQTACVAIGDFNLFPVRKGQVLVSRMLQAKACFEFEAEIYILFHNKNICRGFQVVVHIGNVRQTATIVKMNKATVRMNEKAVVTFKFMTRPEFIKVNQRMLFRQGRTKGMGQVQKITPYTVEL